MSVRVCQRPECQTTAGCKCQQPFVQHFTIPPRNSMPVNLPVPMFGFFTIAVMDHNGGITIEVDKGRP